MLRVKVLFSASNKYIFDACHQRLQTQIRTLYAPASLGIEGYLATKEKIKVQLTNTDTFKAKMNEFLNDKGSNNMIFTEDLKNMIHIAENNDDVGLIEKMIRKFASQNKELRFGSYIFGPVVMRMFYNLNDVETAVRLFNDESLNGFFDQLISYQILLDMLYENKRYQDVLDAYSVIKSRQVQGGKYPKHILVLAFASCYKLNNPEALQYALDLWKELQTVGNIPMRRAATFVAGLALNQNAPHIAIEIAGTIRQQKYMTVRNIKVMALADLKRYEDIIPILRSVLEVEIPVDRKHTFAKDAIDKLTAEFEKIDNKDLQMDFQRVLKFLNEHGHVSDNTLDDLLCAEITSTSQNQQGQNSRDRNFVAANFRNRNDRNFNYRNQNQQNRPDRFQYQDRNRRNRPGLEEMY